MAIQRLPGMTGFMYGRVSSFDKRAVGKLTDTNHLQSLKHSQEPAEYDKRVISLYTQSTLYSNDFLNMINRSTPYYIDNGSDSWKWDVDVPFQFAKIIEIPQATLDLARPGIDGQEFWIVSDSREFALNSIINVASKQYGRNLYVIKDPTPYTGGTGWLYTVTLISENPQTDYMPSFLLQAGLELQLIDGSIGEFDQDLLGLPRMGDRLTMFETLGAGYGFEHTITGWADARTLRDQQGRPLDLLIYSPQRNNQLPLTRNDVKWEPFIEFWMRKTMLETKVQRMIWSKPGTTKTHGSKQEDKKVSAGIYHRMRNNGNLVQYNRGEFSANLLRSVFGDLFYRRVDVANRRVKMYTNEAGFDVFQQALKEDALNSGLQITAIGGSSGIGIYGTGQNLEYNFAFSSMVTRETGKIELVHLKELDLPQTQLDYGQNKKSTPIFFVFDVSPGGDGSFGDNIREVRIKGESSMTWGYIHGTRHHLGFAASQGMVSSSKFDGYTIWMKDRSDVFIEDLSRCVLIEEIPQY